MEGLEEQAPSFSIDLFEIADVDAETGYRLRNEPGEIQRSTVMEYNPSKELSIQGDLISVVHGTYDESGDPATLVVFHFRFNGSEAHGRRFQKAIIKISFGYGKLLGDTLDPEVVSIAPDGNFILGSSERDVENAISANLSTNLGPIGPGIGFGVGFGWERRVSSKQQAHITLYGCKQTVGRNHGKKNTAMWMLKENNISAGGIPGGITTAILLKPRNAEDFQAIVTVDAYVNPLNSVMTKLRRLFGQLAVDPIYFNQTRAPMGPLVPGLDNNNLSAATKLLHELGSVKQSTVILTPD